MKRIPVLLLLAGLPWGAWGAGEKTLSLGGKGGWDAVESLGGVAALQGARPYPVLALTPASSGGAASSGGESLDLLLTFDEEDGVFPRGGRYRAEVSGAYRRESGRWARTGSGSARFLGPGEGPPHAEGPLTLQPLPGSGAYLAPGIPGGDFSISFWLYPLNLENGELIISWSAVLEDIIPQRFECETSRNRLKWTFTNFFFVPGAGPGPSGAAGLNGKGGLKGLNKSPSGASGASGAVTLTGSPIVPRSWSHHLLRFDASLGLLEYLVDGKLEAAVYTTPSGREAAGGTGGGGGAAIPMPGAEGVLALGSGYTGLLDEFRLTRGLEGEPSLAKYPLEGGRAETGTIDLGRESRILRAEASGGITRGEAARRRDIYEGRSSLRFSDNAAVSFFIRCSHQPYLWDGVPWTPFIPGEALPESLKGRYVRVACDFYPGEGGASSPYLEELTLVYDSPEPPPPPSRAAAVARDGAVELSWAAAPAAWGSVAGYIVYYGEESGRYFGDEGVVAGQSAPSPIRAGKTGGIRIEGLRNGVLYYFALAAYTGSGEEESIGGFSRELSARPLPERKK